jgi:endonuclease/exonuclease/phosphatase family metal-dependent hydrolase
MKRFVLILTLLAGLTLTLDADERLEGIACRSVHLAFRDAPEGDAFYNEVTVEKSAEGTYFSVYGFNRGYFGIQELRGGKKLIIFSVWDPGKQDNPDVVEEDRRVWLEHHGDGVRVGRFGNEGTGGQSFFDYDWKIGETYRFMVTSRHRDGRTAFAGYFYLPEKKEWKHLVTFSTPTRSEWLRGYYSFVEDFRRNRVSATITRRARFGNTWARDKEGNWQAITKAKFTADSNPVLNIDAGAKDGRYFLATGGEIENETVPLSEGITIEPPSSKPEIAASAQRSRFEAPPGRGMAYGRLRVATYNILGGRNTDEKRDLTRVAEVIRAINPDLIALQEVDVGTERMKGVDIPAELGRLTGMNHVFGSAMPYQGGHYGEAVLSRFPLSEIKRHPLPHQDSSEPRMAIEAILEVGATKRRFSFIATHLDHLRDQTDRMLQVEELIKLSAKNTHPSLLAGDLNARPGSVAIKALTSDGWRFTLPVIDGKNFTFSSSEPRRRIDYILTKPAAQWKVTGSITGADLFPENEEWQALLKLASDHLPVVTELELIAP